MPKAKLWFVIFMFFAATIVSCAQTSSEFQPYNSYWLDQEAQTVAIGDLNGDGRKDVAVTAWPSKVYVFYQQYDGALGPPIDYVAPTSPIGIAVGDINGDNRDDLAVGGTSGRIYLYYQQSNGTLSSHVIISASGWISGVTIGDFNSDGLADIAASNIHYNTVFVFLQQAGGGFGLPIAYRVSSAYGRCISVGDFNSDGRTDIALLLDGRVCYIMQTASGALGTPSYIEAWGAYSLAAGDVTGDGRADLVFTIPGNQPDCALMVCPQVPGGLAAPVIYPAYDFAGPLAIADVDGDGLMDVLTAHSGYEALTVRKQTVGSILGLWEEYPLAYVSSYQPGALACGDLNSDGAVDVAAADSVNGLVVLLHTSTATADTTPPICSITITSELGNNGWHITPVGIEINARDEEGGSGVAAIYYTLDGANWQTYANALTISTDGITVFGYYAEDAAGNRSEVIWRQFKVDATPPTASIEPQVSTVWPPTGAIVELPVFVSGADSTSGSAVFHLSVRDEYGTHEPEMDVANGWVQAPLVAWRSPSDHDGRNYTLILTVKDAAGNATTAEAIVTVTNKKQDKPGKPQK